VLLCSAPTHTHTIYTHVPHLAYSQQTACCLKLHIKLRVHYENQVHVRHKPTNMTQIIPDMKAYRGVELYLHTFLTSVLDGGEWVNSAAFPA